MRISTSRGGRWRAAAAGLVLLAVLIPPVPQTASLAEPLGDSGGVPRRPREQLPSTEDGFARMWRAHPHNYLPDATQNTSTEDLLEAHGLPRRIDNSCAIRLSAMLNGIDLPITPAKTRAAGLPRSPYYSARTGQYYILSAREMWSYLGAYYRPPDDVFPPKGRYRSIEEYQEELVWVILPVLRERKGIIAFETVLDDPEITGHVDLFDGAILSDARKWHPAARLHVWYVVKP